MSDIGAQTTKNLGNSNKFFRNLSRRAEKIANDECFVFSEHLLTILKFRKQLAGGNGVIPKWDGSNKIISKESHKDWSRKKYGKYFAIMHTNKSRFNYTNFLLHGASVARAPRGWFESASRGTTISGKPTKLVNTNGRIFSSQMPNGIDPWLVIKRKELIANISKEFKRLGVKK